MILFKSVFRRAETIYVVVLMNLCKACSQTTRSLLQSSVDYGRSTSGVISLINELVAKNIRVLVIKQKLDIAKHDMNSKIIVTLFSLFAELERDLISVRTKEALAVKKSQGIQLGKPKGTLQKSKFDEHVDKIKELLRYGLSIRKIAKFLGCNNHVSLGIYVKKRKILECVSVY